MERKRKLASKDYSIIGIRGMLAMNDVINIPPIWRKEMPYWGTS
jgi:hypothetical protein